MNSDYENRLNAIFNRIRKIVESEYKTKFKAQNNMLKALNDRRTK